MKRSVELKNEYGDRVHINELGDVEFCVSGGKPMIVMLDDIAELIKFLEDARREAESPPIKLLTT